MSRPCMFNSESSPRVIFHGRMFTTWRREELSIKTAALTAWVRFSPPTFGVRNWYILRLDRSSQGIPMSKGLPEESRGGTFFITRTQEAY